MYRKIVIGIYLILFASQYGFAEEGMPLKRPDGSSITYYLDKKGGRNLLVLMPGSDCNSVALRKVINDRFAAVVGCAEVLCVEK